MSRTLYAARADRVVTASTVTVLYLVGAVLMALGAGSAWVAAAAPGVLAFNAGTWQRIRRRAVLRDDESADSLPYWVEPD